MAVQVAADVAELDQFGSSPSPRPRSRRCPRAARARCRRARGARRPRPRSRSASTSPDSVSAIPCSETERPMRHRVARAARRCASAEPVKCWSRLPKASGATIRRSTEIPLWVWAWRPPARPSPPARRSAGARRARSASAAGSVAVAIRSMSLQVSAQRRAEPATLDLVRTPGARAAPRPAPRRPAAPCESSSAAGRALLAEPLERREHVLLDLRAEALHARGSAPPRRGLAQVLERGDAELVVEPAGRLRAEPGDPRHLDQRRRGTSPSASPPPGSRRSSTRATIFSCERLADPGELGRPARRARARRPRPGSRGSPAPPRGRRARGSGRRRRARRGSPARSARRRSRRCACRQLLDRF